MLTLHPVSCVPVIFSVINASFLGTFFVPGKLGHHSSGSSYEKYKKDQELHISAGLRRPERFSQARLSRSANISDESEDRLTVKRRVDMQKN